MRLTRKIDRITVFYAVRGKFVAVHVLGYVTLIHVNVRLMVYRVKSIGTDFLVVVKLADAVIHLVDGVLTLHALDIISLKRCTGCGVKNRAKILSLHQYSLKYQLMSPNNRLALGTSHGPAIFKAQFIGLSSGITS